MAPPLAAQEVPEDKTADGGAGLAGSDTAAAAKKPVQPILECVADAGGGSYTAHFGYENENASAIRIPVGSSNKFTPVPEHRGQTTLFAPGRSPAYPNAAFQVGFDGSDLVWRLKGPDGQTRTATASSTSPRCAPPPPPCITPIFGPKRYTRTNGPPDDYTDTIVVPVNVPGPYTLRIENGEPDDGDAPPDGEHRVSSATILVDDVQVVGPSDLNQQVKSLVRVVTLAATSTLKVHIASAPGSFLTINVCGGPPTDTTPPTTPVSAPAAGAWLGTRTPHLVVVYADPAGAGSGLDLSTLEVLLHRVHPTSPFTK